MSRNDQAKLARTLADRATMTAAMAQMMAKALHSTAAGSNPAAACEGIGYLADQISGDLHDLADAIVA